MSLDVMTPGILLSEARVAGYVVAMYLESELVTPSGDWN